MADLGSQSGQWRLGHLIMFYQIFKYSVSHQIQLDLLTRFLYMGNHRLEWKMYFSFQTCSQLVSKKKMNKYVSM